MDVKDILKERIRLRLEATGKSASAASVEAGLGRSAIQSILSGDSDSPRVETVIRLSRALDCSFSYLLGSIDDPRLTDPSMVKGIGDMPTGMVSLASKVIRVGSGMYEYEPENQEIPPDDRILVADLRYPDVPVQLFSVDGRDYWEEGIRRGDILTALANLAEHAIAIENESFVVTKHTRSEDNLFSFNIDHVVVESKSVQIGGRLFRSSDYTDCFQHIVYPGGRMILVKKDTWPLEGGDDLQIVGLVIRATTRWKKATMF